MENPVRLPSIHDLARMISSVEEDDRVTGEVGLVGAPKSLRESALLLPTEPPRNLVNARVAETFPLCPPDQPSEQCK